MKMVSQLTRQAMSRHRLLSAVSYPDIPAAVPPVSEPSSVSPPPTVQPLYSQEGPTPPPSPAQLLPSAGPAQPLKQRTIYGELMKRHDRFTERHLTTR